MELVRVIVMALAMVTSPLVAVAAAVSGGCSQTTSGQAARPAILVRPCNYKGVPVDVRASTRDKVRAVCEKTARGRDFYPARIAKRSSIERGRMRCRGARRRQPSRVMSAVVTIAAAQPPGPPAALSVCLTLSHVVAVAARREAAVLEEVDAIWRPMGVAVRLGRRSDNRCDRLIAVRLDLEAVPEEASAETALGWVPFVEGRARQLVYLRVTRARTMIYAVSPASGPAE